MILNNKSKQINDFKKWVNSELGIKDMIIKRQQEYSGILLKELVFSKNIIKNPKLLNTATSHLNYETRNINNLGNLVPLSYKYSSDMYKRRLSPKGKVVPVNFRLNLNTRRLKKTNFVSLSPRSSKDWMK